MLIIHKHKKPHISRAQGKRNPEVAPRENKCFRGATPGLMLVRRLLFLLTPALLGVTGLSLPHHHNILTHREVVRIVVVTGVDLVGDVGLRVALVDGFGDTHNPAVLSVEG